MAKVQVIGYKAYSNVGVNKNESKLHRSISIDVTVTYGINLTIQTPIEQDNSAIIDYTVLIQLIQKAVNTSKHLLEEIAYHTITHVLETYPVEAYKIHRIEVQVSKANPFVAGLEVGATSVGMSYPEDVREK